MTYQVKEIYYTLQGEGINAGRAAVFLRFAGCNLWSGREEDRDAGPSCSRWCDTDFLGTDGPGGGKFPAPRGLAAAVTNLWPAAEGGRPFVVCTGGEPPDPQVPRHPLIRAGTPRKREIGACPKRSPRS